MDQPRVYLAGPDVFEPDARERYARLSILAEANGLQAIVPMDAEGEPARADEAPAQAAQRIFLANIARLDAADGMVANLADFRGCEPDSGTVFEVGMAIGLGKPVAGYLTNHRKSLEDRIRESTEVEVVRGALRGKQDGLLVEQFGFPLNLMLGCSTSLHETFEEALVQLSAELEVASKPRFRP